MRYFFAVIAGLLLGVVLGYGWASSGITFAVPVRLVIEPPTPEQRAQSEREFQQMLDRQSARLRSETEQMRQDSQSAIRSLTSRLPPVPRSQQPAPIPVEDFGAPHQNHDYPGRIDIRPVSGLNQ